MENLFLNSTVFSLFIVVRKTQLTYLEGICVFCHPNDLIFAVHLRTKDNIKNVFLERKCSGDYL